MRRKLAIHFRELDTSRWVWLLCVHVVAGSSRADESTPGYTSQAVVEIDAVHVLRADSEPHMTDAVCDREFDWFSTEAARSELELTPEQVRHFGESMERWTGSVRLLQRKLAKVAHQNGSMEAMVAADKEQRNEFAAGRTAIEEALLPPQQRRLKQLRHRRAFATTGIEVQIATALDANWTAEALESLRTALEELRIEANQSRSKAVEETIAEALRILSNEQRDRLAATVGNLSKCTAPSIELYIWQLRLAAAQTPVDRDDADVVDRLMRCGTRWGVSLSGSVEPVPFSSQGAFWRLMELCLERYYGDAELVPSQVLSASALSDAVAEKERSVQQAFAEQARQWVEGKIRYEDMHLPASKLLMGVERVRADQFLGELLPHQERQLPPIVLRRLIALRGFHSCAIDGSLDGVLSLTPVQKKKLADLASRQVATVERASRTMESKVWAGIREAVGKENGARLSALVGTVSPNLPGCPDLLLQRPSD